MSGPLAGLRVLDLTRVVAGPLAGQTLADLGADVVKVERTGPGEDLRNMGPPWLPGPDGAPGDEGTYFQSVNRNKRSLQLDIARPEGAAILRRLAEGADVMLENFRPGTLARYGLGWDDLRAINPRLIYASVTGFGQNGPRAHQSGYDMLVQAMSGMMDATGHPEGQPGAGPMRVGMPLADYASGQNLAVGILAALLHRERTGEGQRVDVALFDSQFAMLLNQGVAWFNGGTPMPRTGNDHPSAVPYGVFDAADGRVLIATFSDREFYRLAEALGRAEWCDDPRYRLSRDRVAHRDALKADIEAVTRPMTRAAVIAALHGARISAGPINAVSDLEHDPQLAARDMVVTLPRGDGRTVRLAGSPIKLSATPVAHRAAPPAPGEHTDAVLREWGAMDEAAIAEARRGGIV